MALQINRAILHIIDNRGLGLSSGELDTDSETCREFIEKHIRRLITNPAAREACFLPDSQAYAMVRAYQKGEVPFREFSGELCRRLAGIIEGIEEIPAADILVVDVENKKNRYLAMLKLNYGECFTHQVVKENAHAEHHIVKNTAVLPMAGGKVEEACLIPYDPMVLRIIEQSYPVGGEEAYYFSQMFLECEPEMSQKEAVGLLDEIAAEINATFYDEDLEMAARMKCALVDEAEETREEDAISLDNVARRAFLDNQQAAAAFLDLARDSGLTHEVKLDPPVVRRQFKTQKFKADNGIEVKFPSELFQDADTIQITTNSDGTVSIHLKNLRRC